MSTFNGVNLFGSGPHWIVPGPAVQAEQQDKPPAVDGAMSLDMGAMPTVVHVTGPRGFAILRQTSVANAITAVNNIKAYKNGLAYTLVDNHTRTWYNVKMVQFEEIGRWFYVRASSGSISAVLVPYRVTMVQLQA